MGIVTVWVLVVVIKVSSGSAAVTIDHVTKESCLSAQAAIIKRGTTSDAYCVAANRRV